MAHNILQGYEALEVIASDNANIPYTNIVSEGISQAVNTNELIAAGSTDFVKEGVKELDIVYNSSYFGAIFQYPGKHGQIINLSSAIRKAKAFDIKTIVAAELLFWFKILQHLH
mgnify:CR=1 FL=1